MRRRGDDVRDAPHGPDIDAPPAADRRDERDPGGHPGRPHLRASLHQGILLLLIAGCAFGTVRVWPNLGDVPTPRAAVAASGVRPIVVVAAHGVDVRRLYVLYLVPVDDPDDATVEVIYPWRAVHRAVMTVAVNLSGGRPAIPCPAGFHRVAPFCEERRPLPSASSIVHCSRPRHVYGGHVLVCYGANPPPPENSAPGFANYAVTRTAEEQSAKAIYDLEGQYASTFVRVAWPAGAMASTSAPFQTVEIPVVGIVPAGGDLTRYAGVPPDTLPAWVRVHVDRVLLDNELSLTYLSGTGLPSAEFGSGGAALLRFPDSQAAGQLTLTFENLNANQLDVNRAVLVGVLLAVGGAAIISLTESLVLTERGGGRRVTRRRFARGGTGQGAATDPPSRSPT